MAKTLAQIQADPKYKYTDKGGKVRDRTLNIPHYFKEIPFIYSPLLEKGRVKFSARMQKLYCYVADWERSGGVCYEEQSELAKVCDLSRPKTNDLIELMESIGLLSVTKIEGRRNLELRALPLTDAHITPPEALTVQPDIISDVVPHQPAPEIAKTAATQEDTPAITPQRIRISDAVKYLFENLSLRREDESFYSWSSRVLQRIGIDHSMGTEQLFQETHPYEYTQIEQSTIPF
ncbi:hypothetical protein AABV78_000390 [Enterobacter hormaechei]|uniref:hypothetical protein n=1 Tax=Enterobacter cancerogenus TaxID=69218 RepID=UPI0038485A6C